MICFILTITDEDTQLVEKYYIEINDELQYIAWTILHDPYEAEAVVQEAFTKIIQAISSFRKVPENKRAGYCYMVVRNLAFNQYKQAKKQLLNVVYMDDTFVEPEDYAQRVENIAEINENEVQLKVMLECLDEQYRRPLMLRYVDGMSYSAIAKLLSLSESNARKRVERALAKLSTLYEEAGTYASY